MNYFDELRVAVMPFLNPLGESSEALPVDGINAFVGLFIADVVAYLVTRGGPAFCNIEESGVALDLPDLLAGGGSANDGVPCELPHVTIGLQAPSPAKGVPKGGYCGVEFLEVLEVDGSLQELIGFGDESGTVRGIADPEW